MVPAARTSNVIPTKRHVETAGTGGWHAPGQEVNGPAHELFGMTPQSSSVSSRQLSLDTQQAPCGAGHVTPEQTDSFP
jgi:hypothetical protein